MNTNPVIAWVGLFAFFSTNTLAGGEITDDFQRLISLNKGLQRIVSLSPHNTENLFSAGLGKKIVGVDEYSHYPEAAKHIVSIGSAVQVNIEAVISLQPDLIVAWRTATNSETLSKLEQLGYEIYYSEPRSFEDIIDNIEDLAVLGGTLNKISPSPSDLRKEIKRIKGKYGGLEKQSIFYQVWSNPLMTLSGSHIVSRVLELCGAENIFTDLTIMAPQVSIEAVVQRNPDIIITGDSGGAVTDMSMWDRWQSIPAVANESFLTVDSNVMHRHTARMIMGITDLCEGIDKIRQASL